MDEEEPVNDPYYYESVMCGDLDEFDEEDLELEETEDEEEDE